jgi:RNA polymerase sigma factor (sigma-70 family)
MVKKSELKRNTLNELLEWLDADPQVAAQKYEEIRHSLIKIFAWRKCADPEGMADDVIDRVAVKVKTIREEYHGNPQRYFFGVAKNRLREYQKTLDLHVSLTELDIATRAISPGEQQHLEHEDTCLRHCLNKVAAKERERIIRYYGGDKQEKIRLRKELAKELGIGQNALRVRMFRLRANLETCIKKCLESAADNETE